MPTYNYDQSFEPPACTCEIEVSTNIASLIGIGNEASTEVKMLIDSGADISMIPKKVIEKLENEGGFKLPYGKLSAEDFKGETSTHKSYDLTILLKTNRDSSKREFIFLETDDEEGVLGRDVINDDLLRLDGPNLVWTI